MFLVMESEANWQKYRPCNEPYTGARLLEGLPYIYGKKGDFVVGLYVYLRWVDDFVDERKDLSKEQKLTFLKRQSVVVDNFTPEDILPMEAMLNKLPWDHVPERKIRQKVQIILGSIVDDVEHQGFKVRSDREVRHYNWRTIQPVMDGLFLVLNGKPMHEDISIMKLLDAYMRIGGLDGFGDDLSQGVVKLPLKNNTEGTTSLERILEEYDEERYNSEKVKNLIKIYSNVGGFMKLDIPFWQKVACILYAGEVLVKKGLTVNRTSSLKRLGV